MFAEEGEGSAPPPPTGAGGIFDCDTIDVLGGSGSFVHDGLQSPKKFPRYRLRKSMMIPSSSLLLSLLASKSAPVHRNPSSSGPVEPSCVLALPMMVSSISTICRVMIGAVRYDSSISISPLLCAQKRRASASVVTYQAPVLYVISRLIGIVHVRQGEAEGVLGYADAHLLWTITIEKRFCDPNPYASLRFRRKNSSESRGFREREIPLRISSLFKADTNPRAR